MIISKGESSSILTAGNQIYQYIDTYSVGQDVPLRILLREDAISRLTTAKKKVTSRLKNHETVRAWRLDWSFSVRASLEKKVKFHPCPLSTANPFLTFEFLTFLLPEALLSPTLFPIADKWVEMACLQPFFYNCLSKEKVARCSTRAK